MLDRVEVYTSLPPLDNLEAAIQGRTVDMRSRYYRLTKGIDNFSSASKLVREDEDLRLVKTGEHNPLYKRVVTVKVVGDAKEEQLYADPYEFLIFCLPRYNKNKQDRFKVVFNPNAIPCVRVKKFLRSIFFDGCDSGHVSDKVFFDQFRLGRVDFNVDITTHTVDELFKTLFVSKKLRKHIGILDQFEDVSKIEKDASGFVRIISSTELETFYVGKSDYVLRVYDKVKELKHQIQVCKAQEWRVPEKILEDAKQKLITRIEAQIRNLGRLGRYQEIDKKTGELSGWYHVKRRYRDLKLGEDAIPGYYFFETLYDILTITPHRCDVFSEVRFVGSQTYNIFTSKYKSSAFQALAEKIGLDAAVKMLPIRDRQNIKSTLKQFTVDLNKKLYEEVETWLKS